MNKIRKAIIPAAGFDTNFLPATKAMPKEMLPIIDKPTIQYVVEEAIESGIEDIIIVTSGGNHVIEDHFDFIHKHDILGIYSNVEINYVRQNEPKGIGNAVWTARKFIGDEPFAVLLGDVIIQSGKPCLKQLINIYEKMMTSVIGVKSISENETNKFGIIDPLQKIDLLYKVRSFVEKPALGTQPSNLAIMGRYILTPEIFTFLNEQQSEGGEYIELTDAINKLNEIQRVYSYEFNGKSYEVSTKQSYINTIIEFALQRDELRENIISFMEMKLEEMQVSQK